MTISDEITKLNTNLTDSYTAVSNKGGTLPASENFDNLPNAINSITELKGETKTVTPTTSQQTITPSSGKNGITQVTVNAVTSAIDSDIVAGNIKSGVNILGVTGTLSGANNTSLSITPTTSAQSFTPSSPYTGYSPVNVSAVTSAIDSNIQAGFIRNGVQILGVTGTYGEPLPPPKVACSTQSTWYINGLGELYGCGSGTGGQQGNGGSNNVYTFTKRADNVKQVFPVYGQARTSYRYMTWYINESSELYGCGSNTEGQQGNGGTSSVTTFTKRADNVVSAACSGGSTWYINSSGELYGCGYGYRGQQGSGTSGTNVKILTFTKRADNVKQVTCSDNTTWYINSSGELYGCGYGSSGNQGNGYTNNVAIFTKRADNVVFVVCSDSTTWYINESGELYGCGGNTYGQQGSGDTTNVTTFTKRADNVVSVASLGSTTWYINESGELYGCGSNSYGQQGNSDISTNVTTFTKRADNVVSVASSGATTWYINESGELYGCGSNTYGQQGSGDTTNVTTFTKRADNVVSVASSGSTTWYINESGELYGCGRNNYGQQGNSNTSTNVTTFTKRN